MKQYAPLAVAKDMAFDGFFWPFKEKFDGVQIAIAGSIIRKKPEVHDIDIVVGSLNPNILSWIRTKIQSKDRTINMKGTLFGLHTDVWVCEPEEWAPMLLFATGPRDFNIFMRKRAKDQNMILNQKGVFERTGNNEAGNRLDNNTEGNIIWLVLHRRWIPPEMRY